MDRRTILMNIQDKIVDHNNKFVSVFSAGRFPNPREPRKIKRAYFADEIKTVVASSQMLFVEELLKKHNDGEYQDVGDMIADLHLIAVDVLNDFRMTAARDRCKPYTVEDFLPGGKLLEGLGL